MEISNTTSRKPQSLLLEEIGCVTVDDDNDDDVSEIDSDCEEDSEYDTECLPILEETANMLYNEAGAKENEVNNTMNVHPSPHVLKTWEEQLIMKAKTDLGISHDLDNFQVQSLASLLNNKNVIFIAPCGSGKMLVFHLAVYVLRVNLKKPKGIGLCLQPLNNILCEKTNNNPPIKTAFLTMTGEAVKEDNVVLSHSVDDIYSGEIGCLVGHAESFLSSKGI